MAEYEEKDFRTIPQKPEVELRPRIVHDKDRMCDILSRMTRYITDDFKFPPEWIDELNDLNNMTY